MGQKVNPRALRLKGVQEFLNNWFSLNNYSLFLIEDEKIRKYIDNKLSRAFVSKVLIPEERVLSKLYLISIHLSLDMFWVRVEIL